MVTLEDITGKLDAVVFPKAYRRISERLEVESLVFITGVLDRSRNRPQIIVEDVSPIDQAVGSFASSLTLRVPLRSKDGAGLYMKIKDKLQEHRGNCPVFLEMQPEDRPDVTITIRTGQKCSINPSQQLVESLEQLLGDQDKVLLSPKTVSVENMR